MAEISSRLSPTAVKAIAAVAVIAIVVVASVALLGSQPQPIVPDSSTLGQYNDYDLELFPTFLRAQFIVNESQVLTGTAPEVQFNVNVEDTGEDVGTVTIFVAVYELNESTFDSLGTIIDLEPYKVAQIEDQTLLEGSIDLDNEASTYVWLVVLYAAAKTSVWSVDVLVTLQFNQ